MTQEENTQPSDDGQSNIDQVHDIFLKLPDILSDGEGDLIDGVEYLEMPSAGEKALDKVAKNAPQVERNEDWVNTLTESITHMPYGGLNTRIAQSPKAHWTNGLKTADGKTITLRKPTGSVQSTSGEGAVLRIRQRAGMGSVVSIPLMHSGFWLSIKAPSADQQMVLRRRLLNARTQLGRSTYGFGFSNESSVVMGDVFDFICDLYYDCSLDDPTDFRQLIKLQDYPLLIWGVASSIWSKGFPYRKALLVPSQKADAEGQAQLEEKIFAELVNVGKLLWTDTNRLSAEHLSHMVLNKPGTHSRKSVEHYQNTFAVAQRRVNLTEGVDAILRTPSIDEAVEAGRRWVAEVGAYVQASIGKEVAEQERSKFIEDQSRVSKARLYCHFVEALVELPVNDGDDETIYKDRETVERQLSGLSESDELRDNLVKHTTEFIEDNTCAFLAVVTDIKDDGNKSPHPLLLPLDAQSTFFTLFARRLNRLRMG